MLTLIPDADAADLADYRWDYRPLLIIAPDTNDTRYQQQKTAVQFARADLLDRDMIVVAVTGEQTASLLGPREVPGAADIRERFRLGADAFAVILVGKDGGEKARASEPVDLQDIFDLIDTMPMRQREMRNSAANG